MEIIGDKKRWLGSNLLFLAGAISLSMLRHLNLFKLKFISLNEKKYIDLIIKSIIKS